jgi:hypothetical protein
MSLRRFVEASDASKRQFSSRRRRLASTTKSNADEIEWHFSYRISLKCWAVYSLLMSAFSLPFVLANGQNDCLDLSHSKS